MPVELDAENQGQRQLREKAAGYGGIEECRLVVGIERAKTTTSSGKSTPPWVCMERDRELQIKTGTATGYAG